MVEVLADLIGLVGLLHLIRNVVGIVQTNALVPTTEFVTGDASRFDERVTAWLITPVIAMVVSWVTVKVEQKGEEKCHLRHIQIIPEKGVCTAPSLVRAPQHVLQTVVSHTHEQRQ